MTALTFWIGGLLAVAGVVAYAATGAASLTALIPTAVGLLLLVAAVVGRRPGAHMHAMHAALVVALLGAAGSVMNVVRIGDVIAGTAERPAAIVVSTVMFVLLVAYLAAGVRSFLRIRMARRRDAAEAQAAA